MEDLNSLSFYLALAAGLLATGAVAGILAGLLGIGGGIVIVPVLFYLFDFLEIPQTVAMHVAVATSLATIIPTSISSAKAHNKRGALDMAVFRSWAPMIFIGAGLGGIISKYISGDQLTAIFGIVALLVAINLANPKSLVVAGGLPERTSIKAAIGGAIGFLSSLMGIGGGTFSVPTLTMFSVPVHRAIGTASALGLAIAIPGALGFVFAGWHAEKTPPYSLGFVNIPAAILIFSATILTAPIGAMIAHAINPRLLKLAFAVFLFITALRMLAEVFL